jgi:hypothetical protein
MHFRRPPVRTFLASTSVAVLLLLCPSQSHAGDRIVWEYEGGYIENTQGQTWIERSPNANFAFRETDRNNDFVELFDNSRNLFVRLYNDKLFFRRATDPDWSFNKPGRWRNN